MEIQMWRKILAPYELAVEEIQLKLRQLIKENRANGRFSYIERVSGRVKALSSILDKAKRKNIAIENITTEMTDLAGIRIICQFVDDIAEVVRLIRERPDMEVVEEQDYVSTEKKSGYRSYHLVVMYEVITIYGKQRVPVEIQIRTMAMDFWATVEHSLRYKYDGDVPEQIRRRLEAAAKAVEELDYEMSHIRDQTMIAQVEFWDKASLAREILDNIQNLYRFERKDAIKNIQDEFFHLYEVGTPDELAEFNHRLDKIAARYGVQTL